MTMHLLLFLLFVILFADSLKYFVQALVFMVTYVVAMTFLALLGVLWFGGLGLLVVGASILTWPLRCYRQLVRGCLR